MSDSLVYVYKSEKKSGRYLYLKNKDMFSLVPNELLNAFGTLKYVMMFALSKHKKIEKLSVEELEKALDEKGYFIRIDLETLEENLINQERRYRGLAPLSKEELDDMFK